MSKKKKSEKKGCLFLFIGTLLAFAGTFVYAVLSGWIAHLVIEADLGGRSAYALLNASLPCALAVFFLLDGVLIVNYLPASEPTDQEEMQPMLGQRAAADRGISQRTVRIATIALLAAIVPVALFSVGTYRTVSDEGISTKICFIPTGSYTWEQVSSYEFSCDRSSKGLAITFTMRDGKSIEILQGAMSSPDTFKEKYDCKEAFAVDIIAKMRALQISCPTLESPSKHNQLMEDAAGFYHSNNEKLWPYVQEIIGYKQVAPAT